jgi:electron transfer flavoprotein beta subunit
MKIVVCVKRVPDTAEADVTITPDGAGIVKEGLAFQINEPDNYALEEALLLKEKAEGEVTVVTLGGEEAEEILRMSMAKGADTAVRLDDPAFEGGDAIATARALAASIREMEYDIILTGCMASDDGHTQVGAALAEYLGVPHAIYVTELNIEGDEATAGRELEGGLLERVGMKLPCVVAVQTGINEPRYASIMGIAKAARREIVTKTAADLGLDAGEVGKAGSKTTVLGHAYPPVGEGAEMLEGTPPEASARLAGILKEKGFV